MSRFLKSLLLGVAVALTSIPAAVADDAKTAELEQKVKALEQALADLRARSGDTPEIDEIRRQIEVLTQEIENLRIGDAAPSADATAGGKYGLAPSASKVYGVKRGVSIGGYGEMIYENPDSTREDGTASGRTDQLDFARAILYFGYKFNDRILFNSEIEYEHATTGEGDEEKGEVSVEFAYLDFLFRDAINVRTGLMLVPMGFVNEMHEGPTFLGAKRPQVENRIIPTTWRENGVGVFGEAGKVSYRAYLVTGLDAIEGSSSGAEGFQASGIRDGRSGGSQSPAEDFALTGRLDVKPVAGLTLGGAFFAGNAGQGETDAEGSIDAKTTLVDLHAEYRWRGLQTRLLWVKTSIDDAARINAAQGLTGAGSVGERQYGMYAEAGYDVLAHRDGTKQALIPFVRYERFNTQDRVPEGFTADPANDVTVTTVGASWKPIPNIAIKLDWNKFENEARTGVDQVNLAVGYLF
ncbi:MAG TPA: hypothetical protein VF139_07980 [Candidatus Polarisedimenticolaceae bacterium]